MGKNNSIRLQRLKSGIEPKWLVLIAVGTGTFMSALDTSVVNTVLPLIRDTFKSNIATIEWVVTIYLLVVSGLLLSFGRLGDLRGNKRIYLLGFFIFAGSSALCGLARSPAMLISFRGIQALGAAILSANSPAILTKNFPNSQRGQALGLQATMTYLGLTVGPSFGGWLAEQISWRAIFYINVPVVILALWMSWRFIPSDTPAIQTERFDFSGALIFIAGLVALLLGLNQGEAWGWVSPQILLLLAASIVLLVVFIYTELRVTGPMLDLSLFRDRVFSAAVASAILNYICVFSVLFLMPFYLLQGRGLDPAHAGLVLTAQPIIMAIVAPLSGTLSDRIGVQIPSVFGMAILGAGLFLCGRLGPQSSIQTVAIALAVTGFGTGTFISPNNSALMGSAPRNRQGIAAGTLATARSVGMVLGIGLAGAILTTVMSHSPGSAPMGGLFAGTSASFLILSGFAGLGVLTSAIKGKLRNNDDDKA